MVATPIGNLGDFSPRAQATLELADLILCEDTRATRRLLAAMAIAAPTLWRCDSHREADQGQAVVARMLGGQVVALVSDAGTPGVSDPGGQVVQAVLAAGLRVVAVPGPSSVAAALSVAGFPATPYHFLGFLPRKAGPCRRALVQASRFPGTLVLLESGRRLGPLISLLAEIMPDRQAAVCRELTKVHEEVLRAPLVDLLAEPRPGEAVVVVGPGLAVPGDPAPTPRDGSLKAIAAVLAVRWGVSRREAYQRLLSLEDVE